MELEFKRDTAFRKQFFTPESFAHPAKMDAQLLLWIVERYTKPGEVILDPMAGMGTTMLACTLGRNVVLVELEEKFRKMCQDNWEIVKTKPQLGYQTGSCQIIQADARQLTSLCFNVKQNDTDCIISSPPFQEPEIRRSGQDKSREGYDYGSKLKMSSEHPDNISRLAERNYGRIDKIVTSPPYSEEPTISESYLRVRRETGRDTTKPSQRYAKYDSIITSPPYEGIEARDRSQEGYEQGKWGDDSPYFRSRGQNTASKGYSASEDNIGNLKSDSYLEAMLQVYQQCHKVLKPQGLMTLVTKNFIREKQVVRLDEDTIKLCGQAGFTLLERHYRKLLTQSFWRTIYHRKYPGVEKIEHEDVLIFQRSKGC